MPMATRKRNSSSSSSITAITPLLLWLLLISSGILCTWGWLPTTRPHWRSHHPEVLHLSRQNNVPLATERTTKNAKATYDIKKTIKDAIAVKNNDERSLASSTAGTTTAYIMGSAGTSGTRIEKNDLAATTPAQLPLSPPVADSYGAPPDLEQMRATAAVLRRSIGKQQLELQRLERSIVCCTTNGGTSDSALLGDSVLDSPLQTMRRTAITGISTFSSSTNVLIRKLVRVQGKMGPNNQKYSNLGDYLVSQTATSVRIVAGLVMNPDRLLQLVDPDTPTLVPHVPAILARLDKLEVHVQPILERVLNNRRHLASIEPYLDDILERFDDIEPHLPWILDNIDALSPYCGLLLKHIDTLLLYADTELSEQAMYDNNKKDDNKKNGRDRYSLAEQLLPYLEYYTSRLDSIAPHLPLLRPHVSQLIKHNRIGKISPHIDRLFQKGYTDLSASANMDVLLFWFGWTLRIPYLPMLFFSLPGSPRIVSFLANRLPKRFVRGYCAGVSCSVDGDYGGTWNQMQKGVIV